MLSGLRRYAVIAAQRAPLLDFMLDGLRDAGCRLIYMSDPRTAPYVITFETQEGERMGVVAYAFTATRTETTNRPKDERSFQIKYGSKELDSDGKPVLHRIWQDGFGLFTTIFLGIDPKDRIFIAADPEAHNPTLFYIRLEFKDEHVKKILDSGWTAWERERRPGKRHEEREELSYLSETLVGGTQEHFLDLIRFERAAQGLSSGDRHLLAEKSHFFAGRSAILASETNIIPASIHPIALEFELEPEQILSMIGDAKRLKMAVRGWVAEEKLRATLLSMSDVTSCETLPGDGQPDLQVTWKGGRPLLLECKNVSRDLTSAGTPKIDFQRTRAAKGNPCSRYYAPTDFDIVAGCLHAVTEAWEFRYVLSAELGGHAKCPGKLASNVRVDHLWTTDPGLVFERAYAGV